MSRKTWIILGVILVLIAAGGGAWYYFSSDDDDVPPPPDPMQAKVMQYMPIMFTFFFLWFPAGLVLYYIVNNMLSIAQQYIIMHRLKVENPIDNILGKFTGKAPAT